jgi:quinol monooxygenase YgiN
MATIVELIRFKVAPENTEAMLAARPAMVADFRADREGFVSATLVRLPGGEWLDIVHWRSREDFAASRAKGADLPGVAAFLATLGDLVSDELGTVADQ